MQKNKVLLQINKIVQKLSSKMGKKKKQRDSSCKRKSKQTKTKQTAIIIKNEIKGSYVNI